MSRTYKATGINLKSAPLGETDRLVTILTREFGLVRAVAAGSRKHLSRLGGRSGLFVVNELLIAKGRSLDKITQAETLESYPGLGQDLKKLTAGQYLAELALYQAFSDQPQEELFCLLNDHLGRLEQLPSALVLANLTDAIFQFLVLAGVAPQVHACCVTQQPIVPDFADPDWRIGFSAAAGGVVLLSELERLSSEPSASHFRRSNSSERSTHKAISRSRNSSTLKERGDSDTVKIHEQSINFRSQSIRVALQISAIELFLLQQLAQSSTDQLDALPDLGYPATSHPVSAELTWLTIEHILRGYAEYHFERPIRSAVLIDTCFEPVAIAP